MNKLETLTRYLIASNLVAAEQLDAVVDTVMIYPACRLNTSGQLVVAEKHLNCTFFVANYPLAQVHENEFFARLACWLVEFNGDSLRPSSVEVTVDMVDGYRCHLEFELLFTEEILATVQTAGELIFKQQKYTLLA